MKVNTVHSDMKTQTHKTISTTWNQTTMTTTYLQRQVVHTQSSEAGESETGSGSEVENANDPWEPLIEEAKQRNVSEYEEMKKKFIEKNKEGATSQAYALILPKLQRHLESIYLERLF